ncbi:unnamed protein product [Heligmosomoides polygyrus]|uniref:Reverse transcriptase domain-containing protein n=1 Tax=Heligmosomoides polygyrus TaxID=6339 RepID=A0A3P7YIJ5_HELPZ|nr:unnamed protein product [Heligmosomoides polygyrus]
MTLFVSLERGGSIGHATGTNGDAAGARSSKSMINGTAVFVCPINLSTRRRIFYSGDQDLQSTPRCRQYQQKTRFRQRNIRCNNASSATQNARTYLKVEINGFSTRLQLDTGRAAVPVKTADRSPMHIIGLFKANFTIFDRHQRVTTGQGNCYVTEATDLLGLEWCVEMEQYRQLKEQFHCRLATAALNDIRNETVAFIKRDNLAKHGSLQIDRDPTEGETTVMDNIDEEYDRFVHHLRDSAKGAESLKTTKERPSPETFKLIHRHG